MTPISSSAVSQLHQPQQLLSEAEYQALVHTYSGLSIPLQRLDIPSHLSCLSNVEEGRRCRLAFILSRDGMKDDGELPTHGGKNVVVDIGINHLRITC
jgi:hypothetical protein